MEVVAVSKSTPIPTAVDGGAKNELEVKNDAHKKNRIQVSNTKKPLFFYLNLAKKQIKQHDDVVLSALGMAIPTVVLIAEILKTNGLALEKHVSTSTVGTKDELKGRMVQKPKIEIVLSKNGSYESGKQPNAAAQATRTETVQGRNENDKPVNEPKLTDVPKDEIELMKEDTNGSITEKLEPKEALKQENEMPKEERIAVAN